tara:strand:- start:1110 stop:2243 length:1134 start_codon:yes stop_codon:yes gene_type:complete
MNRILLIIIFSFVLSQEDCQGERYLDEIFDVSVQYEVQYGQNINETILGSQITENLYMDIYTPLNDSFENRPIIFFMFGGSYVGGSKSSSDIVALCTKYAQRGYVAVAIDYRLSQHLLFFNPSEENGYKAVVKAIHDVKAAIRYFRMNDELYDDYKVDMSRVFTGGYSAGAVTAINAAYLNEYEEVPSFLIDDYDSIGGLEGLSGNSGYDSSFHGIVNLSGAVGNRDWIVEGDIPIVSMHGDQDDVVPYDDSLITLFGLNVAVDGSYIINERMLELGNYSSLHTYFNEGHGPYSNMNFEAEFSSDFLYEIVCGGIDYIIGDINNDTQVNVLDVVALVNFILGVSIPDFNQFEAGDINEDQNLNVQDAILLINVILNS